MDVPKFDEDMLFDKSPLSELIERICVQRAKHLDDAVFGEIKEIIKENELLTVVNLNEKAIVDALKKQIPKKPIKKNPICYQKTKDGQEHYAYSYYCPNCDTNVNTEGHHCPCGQAIDWSDTDG